MIVVAAFWEIMNKSQTNKSREQRPAATGGGELMKLHTTRQRRLMVTPPHLMEILKLSNKF